MEYDPLNREEIAAEREAKGKREENERALELADVLFVMNDPAGRRFMHRQLSHAGVFRVTYVPGDPHQTSFNEGTRSAGLKLLADVMEVASEQYTLMLEENKK